LKQAGAGFGPAPGAPGYGDEQQIRDLLPHEFDIIEVVMIGGLEDLDEKTALGILARTALALEGRNPMHKLSSMTEKQFALEY
jgi:hypothetical protein